MLEVLDREPFLPPDVVQLTEWVADYYLAGPGAALAAAMPPHALTAARDAFRTTRVAALTDAGSRAGRTHRARSALLAGRGARGARHAAT